MPITTLKTRSEFLAVRGGVRCATPAFVMEARPRVPSPALHAPGGRGKARDGEALGPRFGFTITKKIGNAVVRNRIRRRLKAALEPLAANLSALNLDYVLVARQPAFDIPFAVLQKDLERALQRVHHAGARPQGRPQGRPKGRDA
jgi:ribonuclease P protein component